MAIECHYETFRRSGYVEDDSMSSANTDEGVRSTVVVHLRDGRAIDCQAVTCCRGPAGALGGQQALALLSSGEVQVVLCRDVHRVELSEAKHCGVCDQPLDSGWGR